MKIETIKIEEIFQKNLDLLKNRIENIGQTYPELLQLFKFNNKDPHIEHMINAFALISSSLEFQVERKIPKEIGSIFLNMDPENFCSRAPTGLVKIHPNSNKHFTIKSGHVIIDNNNFFKVKRDFALTNASIINFQINTFKNQYGIKIQLKGHSLISLKEFDLWINEDALNAIFQDSYIIKATLLNSENYETECTLKLHKQNNLTDFCIYSKQFCFLRVCDLKIQQSVGDVIEIFIPLKKTIIESILDIKNNIVVIENKFLKNTSSFKLIGKKENQLFVDNNCKIINIKKVINSKGVIIEHINDNQHGWHAIINDNNFSIYKDTEEIEVFAEVECINKKLKLGNPFFQEYVSAFISWFDYPHQVYEHMTQDSIGKLSSMFFLQDFHPKNTFNIIKSFIKMYNTKFNLNFSDVDIIQSIKPVKIMNYTVPQLRNTIIANTDSENFLLMHHISFTLRKKLSIDIDFIFNTPSTEVFFQNGDIDE